MVAYRDCKGHLVCMADAQTGIVEIQHKDRAVRILGDAPAHQRHRGGDAAQVQRLYFCCIG